ncbi:hypothetical protein AXG93_3271s1410 [Marchantia polymorpha subsp. ruderalis]|nr:hypothetical protein AXG93_3271s1410 [Marchantia polymorpha subsp. ruderalis]
MAMSMTVGACPCQWELSESRHSRISAFSSGFRASSVELVSKVERFACLRSRDPPRGGGRSGHIALRIRADLNWEKEEARWVREEQRWLREEQRWMREEARWVQEKQELLQESEILKNQVAVLKLQLEELRSQVRQDEVTDASLRNLVTGMKTLLQALSAPVSDDALTLGESETRTVKQIPRIASSVEAEAEVRSPAESNPLAFVVPSELIAVVTTKDVPTKSNGASNSATPVASRPQPSAPTSQTAKGSGAASTPPTKKARTLKSGMDGDDVKELQEALAELGFYSGEEDIEYSMFSDGTESAVKTYQASIGVPEDGLVNAKLLATILGVEAEETEKTEKSVSPPMGKDVTPPKKKSPVVAKSPPQKEEPASRSSREIDRYERTNAEDTHGSQRRVYLLGENRWEEPGRLTIKAQQSQNGSGMKLVIENCFSCRGLGTMLCTDCEGTGDLNVEEQFLEWIDGEEPRCPYCEGVGAVPCDLCDGKGLQAIKK